MKYVAFLRGINVGGTGILPMKDLVALCGKLGFAQVKTYIQSGNVLFESNLSGSAIVAKLEKALKNKMGKEIIVVVRTEAELTQILKKNPFPKANPAQVGVHLFASPISKNFMEAVVATREEVVPAKREVYVHYLDGMGKTKLKLPAEAKKATVRNINTLAKIRILFEK